MAATPFSPLSLHDALPISITSDAMPAAGDEHGARLAHDRGQVAGERAHVAPDARPDRKSTRLNSSHANISYAVFCLKKKTTTEGRRTSTRQRNRAHSSTWG